MSKTKGRIRAILQYSISLVVAFFLLYLAFRNIEWSDFQEKLDSVSYNWVYLSIVLSIIAFIARAYRWNLLIEPLGFKLTTGRTLLAVMIGYLVNLAVPRAGEITRCAILKKNDEVPVATSIGTVVTERIFDLIVLIILLGAGFILEFEKLMQFFTEIFEYVNINILLILIGITGVGGILVLMYLRRIDKFLLRMPFYVKIRGFLRELIDGFLSFRKIKNKFGFLFSTLLIWVMYFYMSYVMIYALPETSGLNYLAGLSMLVGAGIALSIPVQGGFGTYHAIVSSLLLLYGIEKTTGVFFATLLHTSQIVTIAIFGGISLLISVFVSKKNANISVQQQNS